MYDVYPKFTSHIIFKLTTNLLTHHLVHRLFQFSESVLAHRSPKKHMSTKLNEKAPINLHKSQYIDCQLCTQVVKCVSSCIM